MQVMRLTLEEGLPLKEVASLLCDVSDLYQILSIAYADHPAAKYLPADPCNPNPLQGIDALRLAAASSGSLIKLELSGMGKPLSKLVDWLRCVIDPQWRERERVTTEAFQHQLITQYNFDALVFAAGKFDLVIKGLEVHDALKASGFSDEEAKKFFYSTAKYINQIGNIQEQNNAISNIELIEQEGSERSD